MSLSFSRTPDIAGQRYPTLNGNSQSEQYKGVRTIMRLAPHALRLGLHRSERTESHKSIFTRQWQSSQDELILRGPCHYL